MFICVSIHVYVCVYVFMHVCMYENKPQTDDPESLDNISVRLDA